MWSTIKALVWDTQTPIPVLLDEKWGLSIETTKLLDGFSLLLLKPFCLLLIIEQAWNCLATALLYTMSAKAVLHSSFPQNISFTAYGTAYSLLHLSWLLKSLDCGIHAHVTCAVLRVLPPLTFQLCYRCARVLLILIPEIRVLLNLPVLLFSVRQLN